MNGPATSTSPTPPQPSRRGRRPRLWGVVLLALLLLLGWTLFYYLIDDHGLARVVAEADRLDPGWQLEDLEAARATVPDEENSARLVLTAASLLPIPWPARPSRLDDLGMDNRLRELSPEVQLDSEQIRYIQAALAQGNAALGPARQLVDFPQGRYPVNKSLDYMSTPLSHLQTIQPVRRLLSLDALLRAQEGDIEGALASCHAGFNYARSVGDEPFLFSQYIRMGGHSTALQSLERILAQGAPAEASLARLQRLLEDEATQPLQLRAARAERAGFHRFFEVIKAHDFNRKTYSVINHFGLSDSISDAIDIAQARTSHALYLRYFSEIVEITKLPTEQQKARFQQLKRPPRESSPFLVLNFLDSTKDWNLGSQFLSGLARPRCAAVALALERYRLDKHRWPETLADLVPEYLREVPADPFDGAPVRYRRLPDGVVVYTLDPDGNDNGGQLIRRAKSAAHGNLGFRLWDAERRRQSAPPAVPTPPWP
jgi:hypothetical protein